MLLSDVPQCILDAVAQSTLCFRQDGGFHLNKEERSQFNLTTARDCTELAGVLTAWLNACSPWRWMIACSMDDDESVLVVAYIQPEADRANSN